MNSALEDISEIGMRYSIADGRGRESTEEKNLLRPFKNIKWEVGKGHRKFGIENKVYENGDKYQTARNYIHP